MKGDCFNCERMEDELRKAQSENSSLRSIVSLVRRAINETKVETLEELNTLNLDTATRLMVIEALDRACGNRTIAAELLGVARSTMFEMIKKYQIRDRRTRLRKTKQQDWVIEGTEKYREESRR